MVTVATLEVDVIREFRRQAGVGRILVVRIMLVSSEARCTGQLEDDINGAVIATALAQAPLAEHRLSAQIGQDTVHAAIRRPTVDPLEALLKKLHCLGVLLRVEITDQDHSIAILRVRLDDA
jgi:hypothetical protein